MYKIDMLKKKFKQELNFDEIVFRYSCFRVQQNSIQILEQLEIEVRG